MTGCEQCHNDHCQCDQPESREVRLSREIALLREALREVGRACMAVDPHTFTSDDELDGVRAFARGILAMVTKHVGVEESGL